MRGWESAFLGTATAANVDLPAGAHDPKWNSWFVETHYHLNPQFVFTQRTERIRMSRQALDTNPSDLGNIDAYSVGYRWYPIMFSRAGLAFHNEYSITRTQGNVPLSGSGVGSVIDETTPVWSNSVLAGFDIAF